MSERVPVSPKLRFEVFKRDKFTCQYCGAKAPEVVLQADHIEPVAEGGKTDLLNLITSCQPCNAGKGKRRLSDGAVVDKQHEMLAELEERRQQIDMMLQWRNELESFSQDIVEIVSERISTKTGWRPNESGKSDVRKWLKKFTFEEVLKGIDEAFQGYGRYVDDRMTIDSWGIAFNKIPGIIGVQKQEVDKPYLRRLFYIQGILRNRTKLWRLDRIDYLEHIVKCGFSLDEMEARAKRVNDIFDDFDKPYDAALERLGKPF